MKSDFDPQKRRLMKPYRSQAQRSIPDLSAVAAQATDSRRSHRLAAAQALFAQSAEPAFFIGAGAMRPAAVEAGDGHGH